MESSGRVFVDYALVYITEGRGNYYCTDGTVMAIEAGDLILIFPQVWHRYHPDQELGWSQRWIIIKRGGPLTPSVSFGYQDQSGKAAAGAK